MRATNTWFQFKQFRVEQEAAAMKVTTDACLFGAWCARNMKSSGKLLDIGTGTGLLMLMLAQKGFSVDGIELDEAGFPELQKNLSASAWPARLRVFQGDVRTHVFREKYEAVIVNPPFFENDLESSSIRRNRAMHDESLTLADCLEAIIQNLAEQGSFSILLPSHRVKFFVEMALAAGFQTALRCNIKQTPAHDFFRGMLLFTREETVYREEEIIIKDFSQNYSPAFIGLLKDYYLYL